MITFIGIIIGLCILAVAWPIALAAVVLFLLITFPVPSLIIAGILLALALVVGSLAAAFQFIAELIPTPKFSEPQMGFKHSCRRISYGILFGSAVIAIVWGLELGGVL